MDVELIRMPRKEAREAFLTYRRSIRDRHNKEDEAVMRGYRALAQGSALLDLDKVWSVAGIDDAGLPRVAITRADFKWCHFHFAAGGSESAGEFIGSNEDRRSWRRQPKSASVRVAGGLIKRRFDIANRLLWPEGRALVPYIPPQYRPTAKLSNYHILWEAEWKSVPVDPILLKHLAGSLYVVLAQWDLTPLEQSVLAGRLST